MSHQLATPLRNPQRLAALTSTGLLDTPPEERFDRLTRLAARTLGAPMAAITLVDDRRQFFKSAVGLPEPFNSRREVPLPYSYCRYVVGAGRPFTVEDARHHRWLKKSPAIEELGLVSYAGVPLKAASGHTLGAFFLADSEPRVWGARELESLGDFAKVAANHLAYQAPHPHGPPAQDPSLAARSAIEELISTTERFQVIAEQPIVGISIVKDGRIRYANKRFCQMFGYTEEEVLALPSVQELVVEEDREDLNRSLKESIGRGVQSLSHGFRGRRADGGIIHVEIHGSRAQVDGGPAVVGILLDVTEREAAKAAHGASEERFRQLFEDDITGNVITTPDGSVITCNAAFLRMFGYESVEEVQSADTGRFLADHGTPEAWLERLRTGERLELLESSLVRKDGRAIHVLENAVGTRDETGALTEIRRYLFDITRRKEAEEALRRSEERFRTITENVVDIVHIQDDQGAIRYISPAVEKVLGYRPEEMIGKLVRDFVHPDELAQTEEGFRDALEQPGSDWMLEVRLRHRDGSWRTAEVRGKVLTERSGARIAIVSSHDITERVQVQAALSRSEERFRLVAQATNDVLWEWEIASGHVHWSEAAPNVFRFAAADVGPSIEWWVEHIHPEDRERVVRELHQVVHGAGEVWSSEYRFLRGDDVCATLLDRGCVVREETGSPTRVIGSIMDITERRRSEEAHRLLARVSALLESSLDSAITLPLVARAVIPVLADYCVIDVIEDEHLRRAAEAHGQPAKEALLKTGEPQPLRALGDADPLAKVVREREPLLVADATAGFLDASDMEADARKRLTALAPRSLMIIPLVMRQEVLGVITMASAESGRHYSPLDLLVAQDLSRRLALALENAGLFRRAQQAVSDREQVLGVVSHDLRNPLHTIKLSTDLLRNTGEERRSSNLKWLDVIARSTEQMDHMIEDLLDLSSIDAGGFTVSPADLEVKSLLQEVCDSFNPLAARQSVTLRCEPVTGHSSAWVDSHRILRVFSNLLGNALKFTPPGGTITLRAEGDEHEILFSVADTGPGIPPEHLPHVFDRFWQARKGDRRGTGLGLSIARGIVEAHGGKLWVESRPGEGATFFFTVAARSGTGAPGVRAPTGGRRAAARNA
jgi:PAS domain S-box-containing protein